MMNSYFEQSGFYNGQGASAAEQAYRCIPSDASGAFKTECLVKDQNGFGSAVKDMAASWPSSSLSRAATDPMRPFDASSAAPRVSDAWTSCCQSTTAAAAAVAQAPTNAFYPWMAIAEPLGYITG
ncbi:hypothetical protein HPB52_015763 [Rhipicephalus sanguineus]|uniref:Uncharacterized protein n=1 Tax=Rhipicephalus sanguineus TaxID=34632 RepID=A0A9D4PRU8_RHISA|nr:hypothetical protein HPB52_015763 [Rhipicephalus sanguineus]